MDDRIETHPELMNPDWQKYAEKDAWLGAKKDRKQFKKQQKRARGPRKGRRWALVAFFAILAVTTAVVVYLGRTQHSAAYTPPTSVNPTSVAQIAHVDLAHPYANTPAELWKKGIDGITSPTPAAVGAFKADAVANAYAQVKRVLTAARLDPATLYQHDPKNYLAEFAPDVADHIRTVISAPPKEGSPDASSYVTEIVNGYHLLDQGPRTLGTLTAKAGAHPGELVIESKIVVAYAFDDAHPEGLTRPEDIVSFLRADETFTLRTGSGFAKSSRGLWLENGDSAYSSGGCEAAKQGLLAPGYTNKGIEAVGPDVDKDGPGYYDPQYAVPNLDTCPK